MSWVFCVKHASFHRVAITDPPHFPVGANLVFARFESRRNLRGVFQSGQPAGGPNGRPVLISLFTLHHFLPCISDNPQADAEEGISGGFGDGGGAAATGDFGSGL